MLNRLPLTVLIISYNEEHNIARALRSAVRAEECLVVDSGSQDKTSEIAESMGARVLVHPWSGYGQQKNYGAKEARFDWILFLDADEEISNGLWAEIEAFLKAEGKVNGIQNWGGAFSRKTFYLGRWIQYGGWYPNVLTRLAHRSYARWTEPPVHEVLEVQGQIFRFQNDILHYSFRDIGDQVETNVRYSRYGALVAKERGESGSLLKIFLKPVGKFLETYIWKRGFLDGLPGLVISINAAHSIFMKYVELRFAKNTNRR